MNYLGALTWVVIGAVAAYLVADSGTYVRAPEKNAVLVVKRSIIPWVGKPKISVFESGVHSIAAGSTALAVPLQGRHRLEYKVLLSGSFANKWIPLVDGDPPLLVRGEFEIEVGANQFKSALQEHLANAVQKRKEADISGLFLVKLTEALREERAKHSDLKLYSEAAGMHFGREIGAMYDLPLAAFSVASAEEHQGEAIAAINGLIATLAPLPSVPLEIYLWHFMPLGILAALMLLSLALIPRVFVYVTGVLLWPFVALVNGLGGDLGSPFDFDLPDIDLDIDLD